MAKEFQLSATGQQTTHQNLLVEKSIDTLFITILWVDCDQLGYSSQFTFCYTRWSWGLSYIYFQLGLWPRLEFPRWPLMLQDLSLHGPSLFKSCTSFDTAWQVAAEIIAHPSGQAPLFKCDKSLFLNHTCIFHWPRCPMWEELHVSNWTVYHRYIKGSKHRVRKLSQYDLHEKPHEPTFFFLRKS